MASKFADIITPLQPHQLRAIEKLKASGGLLLAHGMGAGKSLTMIAAQKELGVPSEVVVPASIQENYAKEIAKHTGQPLGKGDEAKATRIRSYNKAVSDGDLNTSGLVVFDEAHKGRNAGTGAAQLLREAREAPYRLLGTGTSVYNQPYDLANLLNSAAGASVLPDDSARFKSMFIGEKVVQPGLWNRIRGIQPTAVPTLKHKEQLVDAATGYVDVYKPEMGGNFPRRVDEHIYVPMSEKQHELYRFHEGQMPWYLRAKIRAGLPMTKQESKDLNAFQGALRQVSNTPRPYIEGMSDEEETKHIPKIRKAVENLQAMRAKDPNFRGVVYSNYLGGGLHPYSRLLAKAGIPHALFTGETPPGDRARLVNEYNSGKTPVLLVSSAGSEGLDLKGTKLVQRLEKHWNNSRLEQAAARGIRYMSHAHLPENEREVRVQDYYSTLPQSISDKLHITKPSMSVEQYMAQMSNDKDALGGQIMSALQEASDRGPLKRP